MSAPRFDVVYSPPFAPHVTGSYTRREGSGPQRYEARCAACGESYGPAVCDSGRVRERIAKFAAMHLHRDPLSSHR